MPGCEKHVWSRRRRYGLKSSLSLRTMRCLVADAGTMGGSLVFIMCFIDSRSRPSASANRTAFLVWAEPGGGVLPDLRDVLRRGTATLSNSSSSSVSPGAWDVCWSEHQTEHQSINQSVGWSVSQSVIQSINTSMSMSIVNLYTAISCSIFIVLNIRANNSVCLQHSPEVTDIVRRVAMIVCQWVSRFLTAHQHN